MATSIKKTSSLKEFKIQRALGTIRDNPSRVDILLLNLNFIGRIKLILWITPMIIKYSIMSMKLFKLNIIRTFLGVRKTILNELWKYLWTGELRCEKEQEENQDDDF